MLRTAAVVALALIWLCGPARAGVLSATDTQHMRDYAQFVVPADREMPALCEMRRKAKGEIRPSPTRENLLTTAVRRTR